MKISLIARIALTLLLCYTGISAAFAQTAEDKLDIKAEFGQRFAAWSEWSATQSARSMLTIGSEYHNLIELGPKATPFFAEKMLHSANAREASAMADALARVTNRRFSHEQWPAGKYLDSATKVELYSRWWTEGRKENKASFDRLSARWKELKAKGVLLFTRDVDTAIYDDEQKMIRTNRTKEKTELAQVYEEIGNLGIDCLPLIIDQFNAGDYDLLPIFRDLTRYAPHGKNPAERAKSCADWWEVNKGDWLIPVN